MRGGSLLTIRRAVNADAEVISALNREVQALHAVGLPHLFKPPAADSFSPDRVRSLMGTAGVRMWLACAGETPVGYLFAELFRQGENALRKPLSIVYVNHIAVAAAHRRLGGGRMLMQAAADWAREEQVDAIQLDVWGFNAEAQAFFARLGYAPFTLRLSKPVS
jgi:ribosomal protein S18 acetylase RimI-like enzyme